MNQSRGKSMHESVEGKIAWIFFCALWVYLVFWPSFVLHSRLTTCDCLWFTEGLFWPLQIRKKHFCWNDIDFSVMPRLTENQRRHAIGMLQAGLAQHIVARHFDVHRYTIQSLLRRFRLSGNTRNRQRSGHQVIHVWRHVSKITTQGWCICEIDSRRQVSLQEVSPDYDQSALEQSAIYFVIVTSGHDVHQSVQFCCPGTVHLDWNNIPQQFLAHWLGQCLAVAKPASMQMVETHAVDFVDVQKTLVLFKTSTKWR
jgi:hypothetical protein